MDNSIPSRLFVSGSDTEIGKSVVAATLTAGLRAKYWKPVQSGLESATDTEWVKKATGLPENHFFPETYRLRLPLSPHAAAAAEGLEINLESFRLPDADPLIVEGAGGIMVPLNKRHFMLDLIKKLKLPVLLVVSSSLGTINHTLLSVEQLRRHGLDLYGVIMNGPLNLGNYEAVKYYAQAKVARIEPLKQINAQTLTQTFNSLRWE